MEQEYLNLLSSILRCGSERNTRNGKVLSMFGASLECDLNDGFPLLTTKKMFWKGIVEELAWFLRGSTDVEELRTKRVHIWDANTEHRSYDAGPVYGFQWRHFGAVYENCKTKYSGHGVDQIQYILNTLRENPMSRRMVLSGWCPLQQSEMCLPPCHVMYQFYVESDNRLSLQMTQRSSDVFLGLPFNIASSALLVHLVAHQVGREPGRLILRLGDVHIYEEHLEQCKLQLARPQSPLPSISLQRSRSDGLWAVKTEDVELENYVSAGRISAEMKA